MKKVPAKVAARMQLDKKAEQIAKEIGDDPVQVKEQLREEFRLLLAKAKIAKST